MLMILQKRKKIVIIKRMALFIVFSFFFCKNSRAAMDGAFLEPELPQQQQLKLDTFLHKAASQDNFEAVKNLVEAKADVNALYHDKSPLQASLFYRLIGYYNPAEKEKIIRFLCKQYADVNYEGNFKSPLSLAVCQNSYETVKYLLACKADPTKKLKHTYTLVEEFVSHFWTQPIEYCWIERNDNERKGKLNILKRLLNSRIDPNITSINNSPSPIYWAIEHDLNGAAYAKNKIGPPDVVDKDGCECHLTATLLSYGATIDKENATYQLSRAIQYSRNSSLWRTLLWAKATPSPQDMRKPLIKEELAAIEKKEIKKKR